MTAAPICACDGPAATLPVNPPGLPAIAYRTTDFAALRAALLTPLPGEAPLGAWRPGATGDLAVMIAEWWAYLGDILTFYNERIANEAYLGTATQPASLAGLVALLGYRPAPSIGATVTLAALVQPGLAPGVAVTLPAGLQVQSKPAPGQMPQVFELAASTTIANPDSVPAIAPPQLLAPDAGLVLLAGGVGGITGGDILRLRPRDGGAPVLVQVATQPGAVAMTTLPGGARQTRLTVDVPAGLVPGPAAAWRLERPTQSAQPWSLGTAAPVDATGALHLAGLVRSLKVGDQVLLTYPTQGGPAGTASLLLTISAMAETIWNARGEPPGAPDPNDPATGILIPHSVLTLAGTPPGGLPFTAASGVTLSYAWAEAAALADQPVPGWPPASGPATLVPATGTPFPAASAPVLIADSTGAGTAATVTATAALLTATSLDAPPGALRTPLGVLFNLLAFTRGQTVSREVLGSGDPTIANQAFSLAKSPLTYLRLGGVPTSTLSVTVDGAPWTEVASFFGQSPAARVFTTAQDGAGRTQLQFGDGVTGARLPAGTGNLLATYRFGAGAASPPAGALTVIAKPFPGLRALVNPIAAGGGADPDPPAQLRDTAPRSVLTFGRAVSTLDFEAIAAIAAPGIPVSAGWAWNATSRSGAVTVYVAGDATATATVANALATCGDPNRPVVVRPALPLPVALAFALVVEAGADPTQVSAAVTAALTDPAAGPFGARLGIGQPVFDSQVVTACQGVAAVLAVTTYGLTCAGAVTNGPVHTPPAGAYFTLSPADITITAQQVADGG